MGNSGIKYFSAVNDLVDEVLSEDPVDMGMLTIDEKTAKEMMVANMCELYANVVNEAETAEQASIIVISIMAKLAFENFVLHAQQLNSAK